MSNDMYSIKRHSGATGPNYTNRQKPPTKAHKNEKYVSLIIVTIGLIGVCATLFLGWKTYMM